MEQGETLLSLKVMWFRRPPIAPPPPMLPRCGSGAPDVPKLLLPTSLTQSLVGEPFTGYLHLANISRELVTNVVLKVELQIGQVSKYVLYNNATSPIASIQPGDFFDADVEHELRSAGTYVLQCVVSYLAPSLTEPATFRRSYRFPALQPFAIAHRAVQFDRHLLVECSVENATSGSIYLTSWRFDCTDGFEATLLEADASQGTGKAATDVDAESAAGCPAGSLRLLKPRGSHSLVFKVAPSSETIDVAYVRHLDLIGTLGLGWHVPGGVSGCAEGHEVRLRPCGASTLDVRVASCPRHVRVEEPFRLELDVVNRGGKAVQPSLLFDLRLMSHVKIHGAAQKDVGRLEPYCTSRVPLDLLVAVPGMHGLQGVSLVDELSKARSDLGVLCDILAF